MVLFPEQIAVAPEIVAVLGELFTLITIALLATEVQPTRVFIILREYVPADETERVLALELSDHK